MADTTDEEIALHIQRGDTEMFGLLVGRYEKKIKRYARKFLFGYEDTEDLVQEVFIKAYVNIQSFDAARKFSSWLYRIAHNEFVNAIKKRGRETLFSVDLDFIFPHLFSPETADRESNEREMRTMLDKSLQRLKPIYREPLVLYYFEELDYSEIAEVLHIPVSSVGARLSRGKVALKNIIHEHDPSYGA